MEDLTTKTYTELTSLLNNENEKLAKEQEKCLSDGLSWNDAIEKMRPIASYIFLIEQEMRLKQDPGIEFGKNWKGKKLLMNEFKQSVNSGIITDQNGIGYYASENAKSDVRIYAADVIDNKVRSDFSHVIWL